MFRVLFTGGGGAGNEALFRLLQSKYCIHFADADFESINPEIPISNRHSLPYANDPNFLIRIAELCDSLAIDFLIPGVDEELYLLASHPEILGSCRLILPTANYVSIMLDKLATINTLSSNNLPAPRTHRFSDDWSGMEFPCILKPRHGRGSRDVHVLENTLAAAKLRNNLGSAAENYVIQEKIVGQEYTVQMIADSDGNLCAIVPVKVEIKRGVTLRAHTCSEPKVVDACNAIHAKLPTRGCYNIQLILTSDGRVLPFEINPRVSTTLCLVVAAGIDPIMAFNSTNFADSHTTLQSFKVGLGLRRYWANFFTKQ